MCPLSKKKLGKRITMNLETENLIKILHPFINSKMYSQLFEKNSTSLISLNCLEGEGRDEIEHPC